MDMFIKKKSHKDPWDWYIVYLSTFYIKKKVNQDHVGKIYKTRPMDPMYG